MRKAVDIDPVTAHLKNFFDCVRSRRSADLAAPPEIGHYSAQFCHWGNLSYRVGSPATRDQIDTVLGPVAGAREGIIRMREHLGNHHVDLKAQPMTLGPWLELDAAHDAIAGIKGADEAHLATARDLIDEADRPGYRIPAVA